jgi:hypothetical protein
MNSQTVPGEPQAVRRSADRSLSLERNSMTNKRPRRHRNYVSSRSSTHAFPALPKLNLGLLRGHLIRARQACCRMSTAASPSDCAHQTQDGALSSLRWRCSPHEFFESLCSASRRAPVPADSQGEVRFLRRESTEPYAGQGAELKRT